MGGYVACEHSMDIYVVHLGYSSVPITLGFTMVSIVLWNLWSSTQTHIAAPGFADVAE
jgi:hypothetical protein